MMQNPNQNQATRPEPINVQAPHIGFGHMMKSDASVKFDDTLGSRKASPAAASTFNQSVLAADNS